MYGCMTNYYIFKDIITNLPSELKAKFEYDDSLLFNLSTFSQTGIFYKLLNPFKKDKYKLYKAFNSEHFNSIITELAIDLKEADDFKKLLFVYALISNNTITKYFDEYFKELIPSISILEAYNMLDFFFTNKYENKDLTKISLTKKFPNAFIYYDYQDELIHNILIKYFYFFGSKEYFKLTLKRKKYFYKHLTKGLFKSTYYKIYDSIFNRKNEFKAKYYIPSNKIDTNILNYDKKNYTINSNEANYNIDELLDLIKNEINIKISALNDYLFFNKDKHLRKIFNIESDRKL